MGEKKQKQQLVDSKSGKCHANAIKEFIDVSFLRNITHIKGLVWLNKEGETIQQRTQTTMRDQEEHSRE